MATFSVTNNEPSDTITQGDLLVFLAVYVAG
jgi:hypothetical protein